MLPTAIVNALVPNNDRLIRGVVVEARVCTMSVEFLKTVPATKGLTAPAQRRQDSLESTLQLTLAGSTPARR